MPNQIFEAWEVIFQQKAFDTSADLHFISAEEIKALSGHEPRLMAKFDARVNVPPVFKRHGYCLLPVSRGSYAIVRGNGFHELEKLDSTEIFNSRVRFTLSTMGRSSSEMQYLDYGFNVGLIEHVVNRGRLYQSIRGREGSGNFIFRINKTELEVKGAQIEIDSGFEGEDCIILFEAKVNTPEDFIIRQLYYPYRRFDTWDSHKQIIPVFFTYNPRLETYNFWVYKFSDKLDYNSIVLQRTCSYKIHTTDTYKAEDIYPTGSVYKDLIPQANDLNKVMELIFKVKEGLDTAQKIAEYFNFDLRQSSYYREAAEALGFVTLKVNRYYLTDSGEYLISLDAEERNLYFSRVLSNFELVKRATDILKTSGTLSKDKIAQIISDSSTLSGTTIPRRASSLYSWFHWIAENTGAYEIDGNHILIR